MGPTRMRTAVRAPDLSLFEITNTVSPARRFLQANDFPWLLKQEVLSFTNISSVTSVGCFRTRRFFAKSAEEIIKNSSAPEDALLAGFSAAIGEAASIAKTRLRVTSDI